jgi:hypothetical protein
MTKSHLPIRVQKQKKRQAESTSAKFATTRYPAGHVSVRTLSAETVEV